MRPRFIIELDCSAECVMEALRAGVERNEKVIEGQFSERNGELTLPAQERKFWSTHLGLTIEDAVAAGEDGPRPTRVLGVFQPRAEIWTAYVFAVGVLVVLGVFGIMVAVVQLTMGHGPWGLLASLLVALIGGLVYTSTLVGQGLALGEMYHLRRRLDDYLEDARVRGRGEAQTAVDSARL